MSLKNIDHGGYSRLWVSILQLASGTAASQAIILLTTPLLTRYYSPHSFGVAGFFLSFLMFLAPLSSLNYYQAIILPKRESDALRLGRVSVAISFGFFPLFGLLFYLLRPTFGTVFKMPEIAPLFWLFPIAILVRSLYLVLSSYMSRYRAFALQSKARVWQTVSERALSLFAGFAGQASSVMMVAARFLSSLLETGLLLHAFHRRKVLPDAEAIPVKTTRELAREYRDFPVYSSWAMLLANGSSQLPLILLPLLFTPAVGGCFALGNRLLQMPMQLFGESIRNAYYKEISDRIHQGLDNREGFLKLRSLLVSAGMLPFVFLLFFGDYVFGTLFGAQWAEAGTFAGILGFYYFFQFTSSPIVCVFNAYKKQNYLVLISALLFINNLLSLLVGAYLGSPVKGFIVLSVNGIAIYICMNYLAEKTLNAGHREQFLMYLKYAAYNLPFILLFFVMKSSTTNALVILGTTVLGSACYYLLIYRHKVLLFMRRKEAI